MTDDRKFTEQEWVYAGQRMGSDRKLSDVWYSLIRGTYLCFGSKRTYRWGVGGVYRVEATEEGSVYRPPSPSQYVRLYDDEAKLLTWRTLHDAAHTEAAAIRQAKVGRVQNLEALAPLRMEYLKADTATRRAIEVTVLAYLRMEKVR